MKTPGNPLLGTHTEKVLFRKPVLLHTLVNETLDKLPAMTSRWLQPVRSCVTETLDNNPPISCGVINIPRSVDSVSGGLPHCPCWFEPQQKTWPEAEQNSIWFDFRYYIMITYMNNKKPFSFPAALSCLFPIICRIRDKIQWRILNNEEEHWRQQARGFKLFLKYIA